MDCQVEQNLFINVVFASGFHNENASIWKWYNIANPIHQITLYFHSWMMNQFFCNNFPWHYYRFSNYVYIIIFDNLRWKKRKVRDSTFLLVPRIPLVNCTKKHGLLVLYNCQCFRRAMVGMCKKFWRFRLIWYNKKPSKSISKNYLA